MIVVIASLAYDEPMPLSDLAHLDAENVALLARYLKRMRP